MIDSPDLNLETYLDRIGYAGSHQPSLEVLGALHQHHATTIPFENLDPRLGRPVRLDLASLQAKLVDGRRGGYCFEQNSLFAAVLDRLGFSVETLEARVRPPGAAGVLPRTHMLLRVTVEGRAWLVDVGFGGGGPMRPVAMDGEPSAQPRGRLRTVTEGPQRVLQRERDGDWVDLYSFRPEPALPVDFEMANHFTSTHPQSIFTRMLTLQRPTPEALYVLRDRTLTVERANRTEVREVSVDDVLALVRDPFGLEVAEEDVLRALGEG